MCVIIKSNDTGRHVLVGSLISNVGANTVQLVLKVCFSVTAAPGRPDHIAGVLIEMCVKMNLFEQQSKTQKC